MALADQLICCMEPVAIFPVLAQLRFALHASDGDLYPHNRFEHSVDELGGGVPQLGEM